MQYATYNAQRATRNIEGREEGHTYQANDAGVPVAC